MLIFCQQPCAKGHMKNRWSMSSSSPDVINERWWWQLNFGMMSLRPLPTSAAFNLVSLKGQWEFVLSYLLSFFRSWHLVCSSEEAVGSRSMQRPWPLLLIYSIVWSGIFSILFWWWRIINLHSLEGSSSWYFFQWILDRIVSGEWLLRSLKPYLARVFALCRCLFSLLSSLQSSNFGKEEDDKLAFFTYSYFFKVILCLIVFFIGLCFSRDIYQMQRDSWVSL